MDSSNDEEIGEAAGPSPLKRNKRGKVSIMKYIIILYL